MELLKKKEIKEQEKQKEEAPVKKKRGRKRIKEKVTIKDQRKFFIDYSNEPKKHDLLVKLINEANEKTFGKEVTFKDLVDYSLRKITSKDIEKIKEDSLGEMDKVQILLEKYNAKAEKKLSLGEFLVKQLKIN